MQFPFFRAWHGFLKENCVRWGLLTIHAIMHAICPVVHDNVIRCGKQLSTVTT